MSLLNTNYYIVRKGDFATDGNTKILYSIFALYISIDDYISRNSIECLKLLIYSTFLWSCVELFLHLSKTRNIKPMFISLHKSRLELPQLIGIILQGFQEGGFISTLGLYYGDRINQIYYFIHMHMFILFIICNISIKTNTTKSSKRMVNANTSVLFISSLTAYNIHKLYYYPHNIYRISCMFAVMVYVCSFWSFVAWYHNFRMVEVHTKNVLIDNEEYPNNMSQEYTIIPATSLQTFMVISYDVIFEIGIAYITFYNLLFV